MRPLKLFTALALSTLLLCIEGYADINLTPNADAWIYGTAAQRDTNYGQDQALEVRNSGSDSTRKAYIKFDLSKIEREKIEQATFCLTLVKLNVAPNDVPADLQFAVYALSDGTTESGNRLGEDWAQEDINWNNAPANKDTSGGPGLAIGDRGGQVKFIGFLANSNGFGIGSTFSLSSEELLNRIKEGVSNYLTLIVVASGDKSSVIAGFGSDEHPYSEMRPSFLIKTK